MLRSLRTLHIFAVLLIASFGIGACSPKGKAVKDQEAHCSTGGTPTDLTKTLTPALIYEHEAENYPYSSWLYLGESGDWHQFSCRTYYMPEIRYKLNKSYLPDLKGQTYNPAGRAKGISTDVEVHQDFIKIEVDNQPSMRIPFQSKGFITAERRGPQVDTNAPYKRSARSLERLTRKYDGIAPQLKLPWASIYSKNAKGGKYTGNPLVIIHGIYLRGSYTGKYATATEDSITLYQVRYGHERGLISVGDGKDTTFTFRSNEKVDVDGPVKVLQR